MPFCQTCGELVPDDVHYCPNCGTPMELQEAENAAVPDTAADTVSVAAGEEK